MRCTSPRTVGFQADGRTLAWSQKQRSKEFASFQLPCGKCISCRLEYARQWAIRCVHESKMHESNSFITLTYSPENLPGPKLVYSDFQKFMKKLRKLQNEPIGMFVTGEYGEEEKRPHWHAVIFGWYPKDAQYLRTNDRGDKLYMSDTLDRLWGFNNPDVKPNEIGSVTFESAGYVARYSAKKLVHGWDGEHEYEPISKKSSKYAIGKRWLERHWPDVFTHGYVVLDDGNTCSIPRYYEKWLKENEPDAWLRYVTTTKLDKMNAAAERQAEVWKEYVDRMRSRPFHRPNPLTPHQIKEKIIQSRFQVLQQNLKL